MEGYKVVTAEEMIKIEMGEDSEKFMEAAGRKIAEALIQYVYDRKLPKTATLLVGKGNNGGDAYAAGICLLEEGFRVLAITQYGDVSSLNRKFRERYQKKGGLFGKELEGVILDGLLGTGFKGKIEKNMAALIERANASGLPILAIDIPSGLSGTAGKTSEPVILATETICLGLPKMGLFIQEGWRYVGRLHIADFGLSQKAIATAEAVAYLPKRLHLPKLDRLRHKYQAGYVIGYAGSKLFKGAAKMAGFSALKAGAGIVKVFHPEEIGDAPLELICHPWESKDWKEAIQKADAVFIGPGLGTCKKWLKKHLKEIQQPCVIDADALSPDVVYPKRSILTPHRGEVLRLLELKKAPRDEELFAKIIRFCADREVYVVLKGAPTVVFGLHHKPIFVPRGDPGMATAGTGDILTGIIAGLLAQKCDPYEAALLGSALHAIAGEYAAKKLTSYCVTATDLIAFMPAAFQDVQEGRDIV